MVRMAACVALVLFSSICSAQHTLVVQVAWNGNQGYLATLDGNDPLHVVLLVKGLGLWRSGESYTTVDSGGTGFFIPDLPFSGPYEVTVAGTGFGAALHQPMKKTDIWTTQSPYFLMSNWAENPNWIHGIRRLMIDVYRYWRPKVVDGMFLVD